MRLVMAAMRSKRLLCAAIWVTTILAITSDMLGPDVHPGLHLMDICDLSMVLLVAIYLRLAERDRFSEVIQGMLSVAVLMLVVIYWPRS
ncbi:MAG TPA: hypothetical protein VIF11_16920 [Methylomirabilota bacterium]|jgi:hypothetical protein